MQKNVKVYKEKKSDNIVIMFDGQKLVFKHSFSRHCSDINKKQYIVEYNNGFYQFYHKKILIVSVSAGKFSHIPYM